ncbi:hypothetical protein HZF08_15625 [Paenibacillus sp. CGMCC 1.16610]|uniref:Uncharacterized protein n=1 Tax=Paenibacillus anseongense TaxID=2682845 RepID=A0ABW9UJA9_9BACL|nr:MULTISPECIES: CBO0543 family protein [Paenibacillus]MBA2939744.1 hypothetical protein [Paenibacillus sp. CGMCC 1.16610]MVQ39404.1 hypothetical protein [Paenibacillus anseongense]
MDESHTQKVKDVYHKVHEANEELFSFWKEDILFSWQWWVALGLIIIPWILWWLFRTKRSTSRLLFAGFFVLVISSWFDFFGIALGLWYYPVQVIPTIPSYLVWDFTVLTVIAMFLLQIKPKVNPLIKAGIYGGFNSFIGEPLFDWLGFYERLSWKYIYSFPIFCVIYLIAHYLSRRESFGNLTK